jgi:4-alpha-glucanotransferase
MATLGARPFPPGYRGAGVLLHVTSLPSRHGIGDLGPSAFTWIDRLHEAGQRWWQGLPVGPTGWGDSPYQSLSSFAGNGLLISPDCLVEEGLLGASDCDGSFPSLVVDYETVVPYKQRMLDEAWATTSSGRPSSCSAGRRPWPGRGGRWPRRCRAFDSLSSCSPGRLPPS